ncbi:MAG: GNAT family N-acetyltransferase [Pseudomonadota bacterium]
MAVKKAPPLTPITIEPLARKHHRAAFSCGYVELDSYIKARASQEARKQISASFVLVEEGDSMVVGYYSLSATSILLDDLPEKTANKLPGYPNVPAMLLGRLAVDARYQGRGYRAVLLIDALRRAFRATADVASFAIVVDAKDDRSRTFYQHYDFLALPDHELRLFLPMQTIASSFA